MKYEPNLEQYTLRITGETSELKIWMRELCNALPGGKGAYIDVKNNIDNLEREPYLIPLDYDGMSRLYFNKKEILYTPNVHGVEGRKDQYELFMKYFEIAKEKAEAAIKNSK